MSNSFEYWKQIGWFLAEKDCLEFLPCVNKWEFGECDDKCRVLDLLCRWDTLNTCHDMMLWKPEWCTSCICINGAISHTPLSCDYGCCKRGIKRCYGREEAKKEKALLITWSFIVLSVIPPGEWLKNSNQSILFCVSLFFHHFYITAPFLRRFKAKPHWVCKSVRNHFVFGSR